MANEASWDTQGKIEIVVELVTANSHSFLMMNFKITDAERKLS